MDKRREVNGNKRTREGGKEVVGTSERGKEGKECSEQVNEGRRAGGVLAARGVGEQVLFYVLNYCFPHIKS